MTYSQRSTGNHANSPTDRMQRKPSSFECTKSVHFFFQLPNVYYIHRKVTIHPQRQLAMAPHLFQRHPRIQLLILNVAHLYTIQIRIQIVVQQQEEHLIHEY